MRNPMRNRLFRTIVLFVLGLVAVWLVSRYMVPRWPGFCDRTNVGTECAPVKFQTGFGYGVILLGMVTIVFGPIAASLMHVGFNGAEWETPRGTETVHTNSPLLIGAIYIGIGLAVVIIA
jgi:hypothetical protein